MSAILPPPVGPDWKVWGRQLSTYLGRALSRMQFRSGDPVPAENGILLWDDVAGYPVVSKSGEFRQIILEDGNYRGTITSNVTAASADTAYELTYTPTLADGIANDGTYPSRIVFAEAGEYLINFSAQISSSTAASVTFRFWPRINGVNSAGATMVSSLHNNGATFVASRSAVFHVDAGDYLEAVWATTDTSGFLDATAATAYAPAAPASTIAITRVHG
jgi:hypothetical protein